MRYLFGSLTRPDEWVGRAIEVEHSKEQPEIAENECERVSLTERTEYGNPKKETPDCGKDMMCMGANKVPGLTVFLSLLLRRVQCYRLYGTWMQ